MCGHWADIHPSPLRSFQVTGDRQLTDNCSTGKFQVEKHRASGAQRHESPSQGCTAVSTWQRWDQTPEPFHPNCPHDDTMLWLMGAPLNRLQRPSSQIIWERDPRPAQVAGARLGAEERLYTSLWCCILRKVGGRDSPSRGHSTLVLPESVYTCGLGSVLVGLVTYDG